MSTVLRVNRVKVELELAKRAWTRERLAEMVGCSPALITRWLNGERLATHLLPKVAQQFGLPPEDLLQLPKSPAA